jgi:hypothetical protein
MKRRADRWNFLFIAGMWFQDLFNYDFRRTEMCIIPYATQMGEISFCAYNTEWLAPSSDMHKNATVAEWYKTHGKHEIYARGKVVPLAEQDPHLKVKPKVMRARGSRPPGPMTAADEVKARRKAAWEAQQARQVYEELVLKKPKSELVQIGQPQPEAEEEKVTV